MRRQTAEDQIYIPGVQSGNTATIHMPYSTIPSAPPEDTESLLEEGNDNNQVQPLTVSQTLKTEDLSLRLAFYIATVALGYGLYTTSSDPSWKMVGAAGMGLGFGVLARDTYRVQQFNRHADRTLLANGVYSSKPSTADDINTRAQENINSGTKNKAAQSRLITMVKLLALFVSVGLVADGTRRAFVDSKPFEGGAETLASIAPAWLAAKCELGQVIRVASKVIGPEETNGISITHSAEKRLNSLGYGTLLLAVGAGIYTMYEMFKDMKDPSTVDSYRKVVTATAYTLLLALETRFVVPMLYRAKEISRTLVDRVYENSMYSDTVVITPDFGYMQVNKGLMEALWFLAMQILAAGAFTTNQLENPVPLIAQIVIGMLSVGVSILLADSVLRQSVNWLDNKDRATPVAVAAGISNEESPLVESESGAKNQKLPRQLPGTRAGLFQRIAEGCDSCINGNNNNENTSIQLS